MAKSAKGARRKRANEAAGYGRQVAREAFGITLIALAILSALALASYSPADPLFAWMPVSNHAGVVGAHLAALLQRSLGWGSLVVVIGVGIAGVRLLLGKEVSASTGRTWVGTVLAVLALATLPPLLEVVVPGTVPHADGGKVGGWLARHEAVLFSAWGGLFLNSLFLVVGGLSLVGIPTGTAVAALGSLARVLGRWFGSLGQLLARGVGWVVDQCVIAWQRFVAVTVRSLRSLRQSLRAPLVWRERRARRARVTAVREQEVALPVEVKDPIPEAAPVLRRPRRSGGELEIVDHEAERQSRIQPEQEVLPFSKRSGKSQFQYADVSLLERPPAAAHRIDPESLTMNARILEKKLADFGVAGSVLKVHPGPVITMYEFEPASGVKVGKIVGLSDDLALALRALSVRIIAPLPGKSVVGIEVSNSVRETVYLRHILEAESFRHAAGKLTLALGKDIFGNPVEANLARMPHLLVAGATGTGKSVFLNSLLCSLLFRASPDELKLLLIDPKLLELSIYEGIPHLIVDVVTNPKRAAGALSGIVHKMNERYQMMAALGVRSIDQFNQRVEEAHAAGEKTFRLKPKPGEEEGREVEFEKLCYIVVVVDELADLMVVAARDVEESLQRLAQMARAAGIHLVLATQRPSVDVLTGVIKANFPARISFQVSSRTDSRTILDQNGAENLLGDGDMLFLPPGTSKLQRIHGAFVSEKDVGALGDFLRKQGKPDFDESLLEMKEEAENAAEEDREGLDELYDRGIAIVTETRNASISYLQRRLKIGYNRAARMIEQMEADGVVGPHEGTKGREVLAQSIPAE